MPLLKDSELILNPDGSVYHLNLVPEDIASDIITVGDPDRVEQISKHFDSISLIKHKREFKTVTGIKSGKRITVISTGIGTDNIDIVFNELDALVNIDLKKRAIRDTHTALNFYRIGTSGAIQSSIPLNTFLVSTSAIGLDGLMHYYDHKNPKVFSDFISNHNLPFNAYMAFADQKLARYFIESGFYPGVTITATGFYGPQARELRLRSHAKKTLDTLEGFTYDQQPPTNLEMETAGIYGLGNLLGHRCISLNAILANRKTGEFSSKPKKTVEELIERTLELILSRN